MCEQQLADILDSLPRRIDDVILPWAEISPHRLALVESGGSWTYGQLAAQMTAMAEWLVVFGVRPGDRVTIVCENCRTFVASLLAVASLDAWPVLVNARLSAREVDQIIEHSRARFAIYTASASPQTMQHARRRGARIEQPPDLGSVGIELIEAGGEAEHTEPNVADRVAALIYTSGTTGRPKGVMLTHRNLLFVAAVSARIRSLSPEDRVYGVLPMSHAVGLSVVLLGSLLSGATLYLTTRFDPVAALARIENEKLTIVLGAPSMFSLLLDYAEMKGIRSLSFPFLRILSSSSAPLQAAIKSRVERLFNRVLHNGYGITECSPNIAQTRPEAPRQDLSVGRILPGVEIRLVGSDGQHVAPGEIGELQVRGPNIMKGYYRNPEETAAAVNPEGWFNTRDLARIEDDHLFIVGRAKELIVRFGLNVYPAEVEAVLNAYPGVVRSAVIGRSVDGLAGGEEVIAFVQPVADSILTVTDLADYTARHLAPYKRPSEIRLIAGMPLTPTGKVIKNQLAAIS